MNFQISLISSEPQLGHVTTASPETPHLHKCISLFCSCYWFFAAEMNCSCFASFLKLWSAFPCAIILVEEIFKSLRLGFLWICRIFTLANSSCGSAWEEAWSLQFLLSGTSCVLFWLQALALYFGLGTHQLSSHFKDLPATTDSSHFSLLTLLLLPILLPVFILIFLVEGRGNTGMMKAVLSFLLTPLCSACSSVLWQNQYLKDQSPIVNKDPEYFGNSSLSVCIEVILGDFPKYFYSASYLVYFLPWWVLDPLIMGDFQPTKTQHGEYNVPCLTFSSYFCPPHCDTHILFFAKQRTFCT